MSVTDGGTDTGKVLDSAAIVTGLQELNKDLHFDLAAAIGQQHPYINDRQGVYFYGKHLCSMDRGLVPEYKLYSVTKVPVEVDWADADKEGVSIRYVQVLPTDEGYEDLEQAAKRGNDPAVQMRGSMVIRMAPVAMRPMRGTVIRLGWRHTFEGVLRHDIPGVTRKSVSEKFGVDMLKYPMGSPSELLAALVEE